MQSLTYQHHTQHDRIPLKTQNQYEPRRRDNRKRLKLLEAVKQWESRLPGRLRKP